MNTLDHVKIAFIYDRVNTPYGGAEQVLLSLHELFPAAPLFTSVYEPKLAPWANVFSVHTSFIQSIPLLKHYHRFIPWLMPIAYEQMNLDEYDIVISVSSAEAKGVVTKPHQLHICYLLTPTRYLYSHNQEYLETVPKLLKPIAALLLRYLKWWDQIAINRPDILIPISELVASRIKTFHPSAQKRVAQTIYPPIQIKDIFEQKQHAASLKNLKETTEPYILCFGRLVSYKKFDSVIRAVAETNQKLLIIGEGPQKTQLKELAESLHADCTFIGHVSNKKLFEYIQNAKGVVFPAAEDFGISQVEVAAIGTPVVLHTKSGAAEILKKTTSVVLLSDTNTEMVKKALLMLDDLQHSATIDIENLIKYDVSSFKDNIKKSVEIEYNRYRKGHYEHT